MSDYETLQKKRNIIVGLFVVVAVCALAVMIYKFGDFPVIVSEWRSFNVRVQFPTAPGAQRNTPVRFCGYQVGKVTDVLAPMRRKDRKTGLVYHQTVVVMSIDRKYDTIPSNVEVKLMARGLGSSYIELIEGPTKPLEPLDPNRPETKYLVGGMLLQGSTGIASEFFSQESQEKLDKLTVSLDSLVKHVNDIIGDEENKKNIKATLKQANDTLKQFRKLSAAGVTMTEELSKTIVQLQLILEKVNEGQGTAARLINDGRLYEELLENSQQLQLLLEEVKSLIVKWKDKGVNIKLKR